MIGLSAKLDLPHLAVLATGFGFGLIYILEMRITYSIEIQGLSEDQVVDATEAYRSVLESRHCRIVSQRQNLSKGRTTFVFQTSPHQSREKLETALDRSVPYHLRGTVQLGGGVSAQRAVYRILLGHGRFLPRESTRRLGTHHVSIRHLSGKGLPYPPSSTCAKA